MHDLDLDLDIYNGLRSNVNLPIEILYETFYLLAKAMFVLFVAVYKIITYDLPNLLHSTLSHLKSRSSTSSS